jgi:hypothetical protein
MTDLVLLAFFILSAFSVFGMVQSGILCLQILALLLIVCVVILTIQVARHQFLIR